MSYENVKQWRHRTKERMILSLGGKCCICGYKKTHRSLCFHHLNKNEKDFILGSVRANAKSWSKIVGELKKCVLLCMNCHGELHDGIVTLPNNIPQFDESFTDYKSKDFFDTCPVCGKDKPKKQKTCSVSCAVKMASKINWFDIDLLQMFKEYKSFNAISRVLEVSDSTIRKRIYRQYGKEFINTIRKRL
jgi:hypothetical protein